MEALNTLFRHVVCILIAFSLCPLATETTSKKKPNLLFLMADQMRWNSLSITAGQEDHASQTPAIDRLAKEGMLIHYAVSSTPTCTPARAALLTGRSPWHHGMLGYGAIAPEYPLEMPRIFASAGYYTKAIGKNHFGWNSTTDSGIAHGFQETSLYDGLGTWRRTSKSWYGEWDDYDRWFAQQLPGKNPQATADWDYPGGGWNSWRARAYIYNESLHPTAWVGRGAVDFIKGYPNDTRQDAQPFFLKVSFHRPHGPYDPPQRVLDTVREQDLPPLKLCKGALSGSSADADFKGENWCLRFRGGQGDPAGCGPTGYDGSQDAWCGLMPEKESTFSRRAYIASIKFVDEWVTRIYDTLVERNLLESTWILWTSDHGDGQGDMFHWRKGYPYEFAAHVPMLLRWPETWAREQSEGSIIGRGTVVKPPVVTELRDVLHTFVDAAGLSEDAALIPPYGSGHQSQFAREDGKSLLCLIRDPTGKSSCNYPPNPGPWRQWIDMEHNIQFNKSNHWSALTDGRIKYIFNAGLGDEQLFNLTEDPDETVDKASSTAYATELNKWRDRLVHQFLAEGRGSGWVDEHGRLATRPQGTLYSPHYPHHKNQGLAELLV
jgi:arylsulfatase A-like enzyme